MPKVKTKAAIVRDGKPVSAGSMVEATQDEIDLNPEIFEVVAQDAPKPAVEKADDNK